LHILPSLPSFGDESSFARLFRIKAEYESSIFAALQAMSTGPIQWQADGLHGFLLKPSPRRVVKSQSNEAVNAFLAFAVDFVLFHHDHVVPITSLRDMEGADSAEAIVDSPGGIWFMKDCSKACLHAEFDPLADGEVCFVDAARSRKFYKASLDRLLVLSCLLRGSCSIGGVRCGLAPERAMNQGMNRLIAYGLELEENSSSSLSLPILFCSLDSRVRRLVEEKDLKQLLRGFVQSTRLPATVQENMRMKMPLVLAFIDEVAFRREDLLLALGRGCGQAEELADEGYSRYM
jgi:hypothetical protein